MPEIAVTDSFSEVMPSRLLNCANWATNSLLSCGSSGFWCCIWVTSNCRNASLPSACLLAPVLLLVAEAIPAALLALVSLFFLPDALMTSFRLTPAVGSLTLAIGFVPYH
ncbi:hypothetical protein D3C76_1524670 [compost metagenome]